MINRWIIRLLFDYSIVTIKDDGGFSIITCGRFSMGISLICFQLKEMNLISSCMLFHCVPSSSSLSSLSFAFFFLSRVISKCNKRKSLCQRIDDGKEYTLAVVQNRRPPSSVFFLLLLLLSFFLLLSASFFLLSLGFLEKKR